MCVVSDDHVVLDLEDEHGRSTLEIDGAGAARLMRAVVSESNSCSVSRSTSIFSRGDSDEHPLTDFATVLVSAVAGSHQESCEDPFCSGCL